jgi:hypothetical protein
MQESCGKHLRAVGSDEFAQEKSKPSRPERPFNAGTSGRSEQVNDDVHARTQEWRRRTG